MNHIFYRALTGNSENSRPTIFLYINLLPKKMKFETKFFVTLVNSRWFNRNFFSTKFIKFSIFDQNCDFWPKFVFLIKIDWRLGSWSKSRRFQNFRCFQNFDVFKISMFSKFRCFQNFDVLKISMFSKFRCSKNFTFRPPMLTIFDKIFVSLICFFKKHLVNKINYKNIYMFFAANFFAWHPVRFRWFSMKYSNIWITIV